MLIVTTVCVNWPESRLLLVPHNNWIFLQDDPGWFCRLEKKAWRVTSHLLFIHFDKLSPPHLSLVKTVKIVSAWWQLENMASFLCPYLCSWFLCPATNRLCEDNLYQLLIKIKADGIHGCMAFLIQKLSHLSSLVLYTASDWTVTNYPPPPQCSPQCWYPLICTLISPSTVLLSLLMTLSQTTWSCPKATLPSTTVSHLEEHTLSYFPTLYTFSLLFLSHYFPLSTRAFFPTLPFLSHYSLLELSFPLYNYGEVSLFLL